MTRQLPGNGLMGWLGRQVGYIRRALRSDPSARVVYRADRTEESKPPEHPEVRLRRTTIDEVIVQKGDRRQ